MKIEFERIDALVPDALLIDPEILEIAFSGALNSHWHGYYESPKSNSLCCNLCNVIYPVVALVVFHGTGIYPGSCKGGFRAQNVII